MEKSKKLLEDFFKEFLEKFLNKNSMKQLLKKCFAEISEKNLQCICE